MIPINTDQLGKWMAPPNEPEVKVRRGQRNDYEHRDVLTRSGMQGVHRLGAKLGLIAARLLLSMFSSLLPRVAGMAFAVAVLRMPMCLDEKARCQQAQSNIRAANLFVYSDKRKTT
jgi:hypothetical protein